MRPVAAKEKKRRLVAAVTRPGDFLLFARDGVGLFPVDYDDARASAPPDVRVVPPCGTKSERWKKHPIQDQVWFTIYKDRLPASLQPGNGGMGSIRTNFVLGSPRLHSPEPLNGRPLRKLIIVGQYHCWGSVFVLNDVPLLIGKNGRPAFRLGFVEAFFVVEPASNGPVKFFEGLACLLGGLLQFLPGLGLRPRSAGKSIEKSNEENRENAYGRCHFGLRRCM